VSRSGSQVTPSKGSLVLRRTVLVLAAAVGITVSAAPAQAITNGTADGNAHPSVGGLVAAKAYEDGTWTYCSGTLISPTVFLTAAHCEEGDQVKVTFSSAYHDGDPVYVGTWHADPLYTQAQNDPHDIAVVVFARPVPITPAQLPAAGSLAALSKDQTFTSVGYGAYQVVNAHGAGGHAFVYDDVRMRTTGTLNAVTPAWLRISGNPATGNGNTCYGDSGGPNFLGTSNVVAATTITGDGPCRATNVDYRLDTPAARAFLAQYVALP
jgi:V8-like Glu-specific endopeptidase